MDSFISNFVPIVGHYGPDMLLTESGAAIGMFQCAGAPLDLASAEAVIDFAILDNGAYKSVADPRLEIVDHFARRDRQSMTALPAIGDWFANRFDEERRARAENKLFRNENYVSIVLRPRETLGRGLRALFGAPAGLSGFGEDEAEEFEGVMRRVQGGLDRYGAVRLGVRRENGVWFSRMFEALHIVLNNRARPIGIPDDPDCPVHMGAFLVPSRPVFDVREARIIGEDGPHYVAVLSFFSYPPGTRSTMFDAFREAEYGLTITRSSRFIARSTALSRINEKLRWMRSSDDAAKSQAMELSADENAVASGHTAYVQHHFSVAIHARSLRQLDRNVANAQHLIDTAGAIAERETDALKPAFYAQLPGNTRWQPRPGPIKTENAVMMAAKFGVPAGRMTGRWGAPVCSLESVQGTEHLFHFHIQGSQQTPAEDLGNMLIYGPAGVGKTSLIGGLMLGARRNRRTRVVVIDRGLGLSVAVCAAGGSYLPLGQRPLLAPLKALSNTLEDWAHLVALFRGLILNDGLGPISSEEDARLGKAVAMQMEMPAGLRSMTGIAAMLGNGSAAARLMTWCRGGRRGIVFDNDEDAVDMSHAVTGFDTTEILKDEEIISPILNHLFYRTRKLLNGDPLLLIVDEAWQADKAEVFRGETQEHLRTIRKNEGVVALATQNVGASLKSDNADDYLQQIPTKILFADSAARQEHFVGGLGTASLGVGEAVWRTVKEDLPNRAHTFVVHRPDGAFLARYDLSGMPGKAAVLSARASTYALMRRLQAQHGTAPEAWVPHFEREAPGIVDDPTDARGERAAAAA